MMRLSSFLRKPKPPDGYALSQLRVRLFDERAMRFAKLRNADVMIYWPHGFGDFVHLGYLLPLLEPSNTYRIARYGDDFSDLYADNAYAKSIPSGIAETRNAFGNAARDFHLGVPYGSANGGVRSLTFAEAFAVRIRECRIDGVLWTDYPDAHGGLRFPYHTKIRSLARRLLMPERAEQIEWRGRLRHALEGQPPDIEADVRVRNVLLVRFETISELCVVQSGGHTGPDKRWDRADVFDFAKRFLASDARRCVIMLDEDLANSQPGDARIASFTELFNERAAVDGRRIGFARLMRSLLAVTQVMVGVPAGPTHLALALGSVPTVGLWRAHHPLAYEEPNPAALHLVSERVRGERSGQNNLEARVPTDFHGCMRRVPGTTFPGSTVFEAVEELMSAHKRRP